MSTPIDRLLDEVDWKCTRCGAKAGTCDCWTRCECGRMNPTGKLCSNEIHRCSLTVRGARCYLEVGHNGECL